MVNFFFSSVCHLLNELNLLIRTSHNNMRIAARFEAIGDEIDDPKHDEAVGQANKGITFCVDSSEKLFAELKCLHIEDATQRLRNTPQDPLNWSELNTRSRALRNAIEVELRGYLFYQYPKDKGEKFRNWMEDWKTSLKAFPDIRMDVFGATDCYALQHNTASVFHSMRVAEYGLRALAKERKVTLAKNKPVEWATWQEIIRALDDQIRLIGQKSAGTAKDRALEFYSGARADLNGFKDEYRNQVMHVRASYDGAQALRALDSVHRLMERISEKIDHTHKRIKWGLR
ncbi:MULTISPECIES: hypothetical protein [unclassified Bradyrhizobium]|uniref:hypothetical protein n=1 Tax=unclassified Bradyrhizobium TaxID=2631580 RepID=UPI0028EE6D62|nr:MULTISPECIES: hypothetical protein [unclassified Bradyrhizobium]